MSTVSSKDTIEDLDLNDEFYVIKKDGETRTSHKVDGKAMAALFRPTYRILLTTALPPPTDIAANTDHKLVIDDANSQNIAPVTLNDDKTVITLPAGKLYKITLITEVNLTVPDTFRMKITSNPVGGAVRAVDSWENTPQLYYVRERAGQIFSVIDLTGTETNEEVCIIVENTSDAVSSVHVTQSTIIIEEFN